MALAAALCGCSLNRIAARQTGDIIRRGMPVYLEDGDEQTARETLLSSVKLTEAVLQSDPQNSGILETLAQGYCGYAFMFAEDADPKRASLFYKRGEEFSRRILAARGIIAPEGDFLKKPLRAADAPAAFWNGFCRAGYAQLNLDDTDAIADISRIDALLDAVLEADPSYYYNGAHALKGALLAARPPMFGGDPAQARRHFEAALSGPGADFLPNKFAYAKTYAVRVQDAELFDRLLKEVLDAYDRLPQQRLANTVAKTKARKLLEKKDDLF